MLTFVLAAVVGLITGVLTGAGIGGGTLLVLYLTGVLGVEQGLAQGVNLLYFLVSAPAALVGHIRNKLIDIRFALFAALFGSAIALITALFVCKNVEEALLRKGFAVLFIVVGIKELRTKKPANN